MFTKRIIFSLAIGAAVLAVPQFSVGQEQESTADRLQAMDGVWQVSPRGRGTRGGGPDGPPPGMSGDRTGRGDRAMRGPPPDGDGAGLPGPDIEGLDMGDRRTYSIMTAEGRAAFEAMNPRDLPANNCRTNGLPSLVGIPDVQEWSVDGPVLTVHYADFDTYRTIYLDGRAAPADASHLGHSTGAFEGGDFVVTTTSVLASPGGLGRNAPGSGSRTYVERYHLDGGGQAVSGSVTIHDPLYLTQDIVVPIAFRRAEEGVIVPEGIPCSVEASQRYLD